MRCGRSWSGLRKQPVSVEVAGGETMPLGVLDLQRALTAHANRSGAWPAFIAELYRGNYRPLAEIALRQRDVRQSRSVLYAMDCASGISAEPAAADPQKRRDAAAWRHQPALFRHLRYLG